MSLAREEGPLALTLTSSVIFSEPSGRAAKFQNGFDAWQRMAYHCDFEMETKKLVAVSVRPLHP